MVPREGEIVLGEVREHDLAEGVSRKEGRDEVEKIVGDTVKNGKIKGGMVERCEAFEFVVEGVVEFGVLEMLAQDQTKQDLDRRGVRLEVLGNPQLDLIFGSEGLSQDQAAVRKGISSF